MYPWRSIVPDHLSDEGNPRGRVRGAGRLAPRACAAPFGADPGYHVGSVRNPDRSGCAAGGDLNVALLELDNLHVALEDGTEIVKGVDLEVDLNEVHAIMGPNGSGKSTLSYAIAGHPAYRITEGRVLLDGRDITEAGADERAQQGLFLAFQYPQAIPGVRVTDFLRTAINVDPPRKGRGRRRPGADQGVPRRALHPDGPAQGLARARLALPQRRVLGRREEAGRDPPDGDAEAAHGRARRDRLGARHRRAQGRRRRRPRARRARAWARS